MSYMKALQVTKPRDFKLVQVAVPTLENAGPEKILVQPETVSLCGSDIPFFTGSKRSRNYPLPVGAPIHECVGRVIESSSEQFHSGDLVVAIPEGDQGLAEFFVAQSGKAVKLPSDINDIGTACLIQPLSTVINGVDRLGCVEGRSVAVIGLGSIGLLFCWLLKRRGAASVIGIDPLRVRCQVAEKLGADRTINQRSIEVLHATQQGSFEWRNPDICIEAVGHQMDTLNDCLGLVRKQGTILAFGVPDHHVYAIEYETLFRKNLQLLAVVTPEWNEYLVKSRELFLENRETLDRFVTHRMTIHDATKAFTLYERHEDGIIKALISTTYW